MTLDALLKEVERLDKAATPGPWRVLGYDESALAWIDGVNTAHGYEGELLRPDADLVVAFRRAAPLLARMLREAVGALKSSRDIIKRLPKHEVAGKYCAACSEKSGWDAWERAEKNDDPSGLACDEWCPTPAAYRELAAIKAALSRLDAMAGEVGA